ncbi:hypothetical protein [Helicobacter brantae]|uniref:Uncharacterized protein n=1 Tax=Helicobacter brantae TaxID=375927 RepID=A0A3D8J2R3_9HELI|nr:hypothetical protein [Helicobacter brantae]RDU71144.1 hypothetical protein CQA58_03255 [Helicobacter brantae]
MVKIFCGSLISNKNKEVLEKKYNQEIEWIIDKEKIKEAHLVLFPSLNQIQEAKRIGIPFYFSKNSKIKKVRFFFKQILREFLDNLLLFRIIPPPPYRESNSIES